MKIQRPTLGIFLTELRKLPAEIENVEECAKNWIAQQESRENGYHDQYYTSLTRERLERSLIELRKVLAEVYDTQGDRGLF